MNDFKIYEHAKEMFAQNGQSENEDCIFVAIKDTNSEGLKSGLSGTMGIVGGVIADSIRAADALNNIAYDALLINQNKSGIGIIPLWTKGVSLTSNLAKMEAKIDNYFFIPSHSIKEIIIKNFNIFNRKVKRLKFIFNDESKIQVLVRMNEKLIPYQCKNFTIFMNRFNND